MPESVRFVLSLDEPESREDLFKPGSDPVPLILEPGQMVQGTVEAFPLEDLEFREVQIRFLWHTEGKGNRVTGEGSTQMLARGGRWAAGSDHLYSFVLRAPWGPLSYAGKILRVVWALEVRVDRSLLRSDIVEGTPVILAGTPDLEKASLGPVPQEKKKLEAVKKGLSGFWLAAGLAILLLGIVFGAVNGWDLNQGEKWLVFLLMGGGFLLTLRGFWARLGRGKLGEPTVHLSTTELRRGGEIRFSVSLRPEQRTELRSLEAILECEERVVHGHGQYQKHHRRVVFEKRLALAEDLTVEANRALQRKGTLTLPTDAAPSFGAPYSQVVWWLRFQGDIVGWPDWKEPVLLTVWP